MGPVPATSTWYSRPDGGRHHAFFLAVLGEIRLRGSEIRFGEFALFLCARIVQCIQRGEHLRLPEPSPSLRRNRLRCRPGTPSHRALCRIGCRHFRRCCNRGHSSPSPLRVSSAGPFAGSGGAAFWHAPTPSASAITSVACPTATIDPRVATCEGNRIFIRLFPRPDYIFLLRLPEPSNRLPRNRRDRNPQSLEWDLRVRASLSRNLRCDAGVRIHDLQ